MKVLFLTQWYPNRYDAMAGLFVRNHAEAVARQGVDVCVLYCHPVGLDHLEELGKQGLEIVWQETNGVKEVYVYHSCFAVTALQRGRDEVTGHWGIPDVCQVNVLSKSALVAYDLCFRWEIPYVIVEHWSGYLPENGDYLRNTGRLQRWLYERIARKAKCILPVSKRLMKAMQDCGIANARWEQVQNVVYDCFFEEAARPEAKGPYEVLHVSCFDEKAKNVRGILEAVKMLETRRTDFRLRIIGTGQDFEADKAYAKELGLQERVVFEGEKTPEEVCAAMQQAHMFVLFSRYENAPVVLSECMAVGLPVVATKVGGIPEMVNTDTGVLVPSENVPALMDAIDKMLNVLPAYHAETIRRHGQKYSYETVGKQLKALYESVLS
ncbi:MAG: glycosyltransferase [Paludibacteraceae bacterium]|nr:glycosyltransferase [Paludibacteraceae bacterium]